MQARPHNAENSAPGTGKNTGKQALKTALRTLLTTLCACAIIATPSYASAGNANGASYKFDISGQTLPQSLRNYAQVSGQEIIFTEDLFEGTKLVSLKGNYTAIDALEKLLKGTGLKYERSPSGAIMIRRAGEGFTWNTNNSPLHGRGEGSGGKDSLQLAGNQNQSAKQTDSTSGGNGADNSNNSPEGTPSKIDCDSPSSRDDPSCRDGNRETLQEIVVTAQKRRERIQDLPFAISAFSEETLVNRGIEDLSDLSQLSPSLQIGERTASYTTVSIRGISSEVLGFIGEPAVSISQDGVAYTNQYQGHLDFFDVERVEVLRGPQGTLGGRNATAGAINVISKRPTEESEGGLKTTFGNYDRLAVEGYVSGPLVKDRLLGRLAVQSDRADGWIHNTLLRQDVYKRDKLKARASLLAHLSDDLEAHLILEGVRDRGDMLMVDNGRLRPDVPTLPEFLGVPAFDRERRTVSQDLPALQEYEKHQATLRLAWNLGPSATLTSTTGYVDLSVDDASQDLDATIAQALVWGRADPRTAPAAITQRQASQEFTLTSDLTDRLDLIIGALYLHSDASNSFSFGLPLFGVPPGAFSLGQGLELTSWAAYTQWRYRLTEEIRLTAGVRYTHDTKDVAERSAAFGAPIVQDADGSWKAWMPRFAVDYAPSDNLILYTSVARGYKAGGFDGILGTPAYTYAPEYVWNYEAGVKADWFDRRLSTALTGFYMDYTDLQQSITGIEPGQVTPRIVNAAAATIKGVELELDALVSDRFRVNFSGTWLDATYDELHSFDPLFPELGVLGPAGLNIRDLSGNPLARAPEWQFNVSGEYRVPLSGPFVDRGLQGVLRASYAWQDRNFFNFYHRESMSQGAYGLVNLSGAIETMDGRWQLSAFVHNLTDRYYTRYAQELAIAPVRFSSAWPGEPRTYGVSVAYRF